MPQECLVGPLELGRSINSPVQVLPDKDAGVDVLEGPSRDLAAELSGFKVRWGSKSETIFVREMATDVARCDILTVLRPNGDSFGCVLCRYRSPACTYR